jgi:hypothetical protein
MLNGVSDKKDREGYAIRIGDLHAWVGSRKRSEVRCGDRHLRIKAGVST